MCELGLVRPFYESTYLWSGLTCTPWDFFDGVQIDVHYKVLGLNWEVGLDRWCFISTDYSHSRDFSLFVLGIREKE